MRRHWALLVAPLAWFALSIGPAAAHLARRGHHRRGHRRRVLRRQIEGGAFTIETTVPDLDPGVYEIDVRVDGGGFDAHADPFRIAGG